MLNKFELLGVAGSILAMAVALYLVRFQTNFLTITKPATQVASVVTPGIITVDNNGDQQSALKKAIVAAANPAGALEQMIVDDVKIGIGEPVKEGDTVVINYIGTLQNGQEFDNSNKRGEPLTFKVGEGRVVKGLETGIVGMKQDGSRILVIPPALGYGAKGYGPIPGGANLVFAIELIAIK